MLQAHNNEKIQQVILFFERRFSDDNICVRIKKNIIKLYYNRF